MALVIAAVAAMALLYVGTEPKKVTGVSSGGPPPEQPDVSTGKYRPPPLPAQPWP